MAQRKEETAEQREERLRKYRKRKNKYRLRTKPAEDNHKSRCKLCAWPEKELKTIESMWVKWYSAGEIAQVIDGLVGSGNGGYETTDNLQNGLTRHAIFTGIEDKRLSNWQGANKQIIRLGQIDHRGLSPKSKAYLASKAVDSEAKMAAPTANTPAVTINFGNVPTATLEQKTAQLLKEIQADVEVIEDEPEQIENKGETEGE